MVALGVMAAAATIVAAGAAAPAAAVGEVRGIGHPNAVPDSYLVVFKDETLRGDQAGIRTQTDRLAAKYDVKVEHVYEYAVRGFAGTMTLAAARRLAAEADVAYVEQNVVVHAFDTQLNPPSWGLDRIDQRDLPLDQRYTYRTKGSSVLAYVIDTGIRITHTTFGGRAIWGTNTTGDGIDTDCNYYGHGTHVAGTIGGAEYGVAKGVTLVAVKVLGCDGSGSLAGVVAGVDWVTGHHQIGKPAVANMSLGANGHFDVLEDAVRNSIADGIVYTIASGNSNIDACNVSPARVTEAITVNASTINDLRASYSNWGTCTDIFAPGDEIVSASNASDTAFASLRGTSMAAPHVAGAAALLLDQNALLTPSQVTLAILRAATPNKIPNPGTGSPNRLLFTGASLAPSPIFTTLARFSWPGVDRLSSTTHPGGRYEIEDKLGVIATTPVSGTIALYQCSAGADYFTSIRPDCEGQTYRGVIGYAYRTPPSDISPALYRCLSIRTGDRFDSTEPSCEGQQLEGRLGYLSE